MATSITPAANMDALSLQRIAKLHPKLRVEATQILGEITCKVNTPTSFCRFTHTLRTMSEQQALYNQGRTTKGPKVTNARAGSSYHNYGLAIDIAFVIDNKVASWDTKRDWNKNLKPDWMEVVEIFKKFGWFWGGDFKSFKDLPHFEKAFGYRVSSLLELHRQSKIDKDGFVII